MKSLRGFAWLPILIAEVIVLVLSGSAYVYVTSQYHSKPLDILLIPAASTTPAMAPRVDLGNKTSSVSTPPTIPVFVYVPPVIPQLPIITQILSIARLPLPCSADGVQIGSGESRAFFTQRYAVAPDSCSSHAETRSCLDGILSGSYPDAVCVDAAPGPVVGILPPSPDPTPQPNPVPTPTPAPGPFPQVVLPDTTGGFHLAQEFNYSIPNKNYASEVGKVDIVWGAATPSPSSVINLFYTPLERDNNHIVSTDPAAPGRVNVTWFKQYHPDWIEYTCNAIGKTEAQAYGDPTALPTIDPNSNPISTTDIAFEYYYSTVTHSYGSTPGTAVPLDMSNPDVRNFLWTASIQPALASGYGGVALDNASSATNNDWKRCGHFDLQGNFIQQYTGRFSQALPYDPNGTSGQDVYRRDSLGWLTFLSDKVHGMGKILAINSSFLGSNTNPDVMNRMMAAADLDISEGGFNNVWQPSTTVATWSSAMSLLQTFQAQGKSIWIMNNLLQTTVTGTAPGHPNCDIMCNVQWNFANFLLIANNHAFFSGSPLYLGAASFATLEWICPTLLTPALNTWICNAYKNVKTLGNAKGAMYQSQNVYMRDFVSGKAIVNPDLTHTYTVTIPTSYTDLQKAAAPTTITLAPQTGVVLLGGPGSPPAAYVDQFNLAAAVALPYQVLVDIAGIFLNWAGIR